MAFLLRNIWVSEIWPGWEISFIEIGRLKTMVCNTNNRDCMLHSRDQCPGTVAPKEKLESVFDEYEKEHIKFKQWKKDENKTNLLVNCQLKNLARKFSLILTHYELTTSSINHHVIFWKIFKKKIKRKWIDNPFRLCGKL